MQMAFSSNVTSDMVTLTNFVKNFNFCGGLHANSLVAKPLSDLYYDSRSNFQQSNDWQKSPVHYWFINSKMGLFIQRKMELIKTKDQF